jgi:hypothetical protein
VGIRQQMETPHSEQGFALIVVIWLMMFAGSVTAVLLLRASTAMKEARQEAAYIQEALALDGAADAIAAERLFGRPGSPWAIAGTSSIDMDGVAISGRISPEEQRLNMAKASAAAVDAVLQSAGIDRPLRRQVLGRLASAGLEADGTGSMVQLAHILAPAQVRTQACLLDRFTMFGGRSQAAFADAGSETGQPILPGALFRLELRSPGGQVRAMLLRIAPANLSPVFVSDWRMGSYCP